MPAPERFTAFCGRHSVLSPWVRARQDALTYNHTGVIVSVRLACGHLVHIVTTHARLTAWDTRAPRVENVGQRTITEPRCPTFSTLGAPSSSRGAI